MIKQLVKKVVWCEAKYGGYWWVDLIYFNNKRVRVGSCGRDERVYYDKSACQRIAQALAAQLDVPCEEVK